MQPFVHWQRHKGRDRGSYIREQLRSIGTPSTIEVFKFSMQTMQVRIRRGAHRWSRSLVTPSTVCICCTSLCPSTGQGNNQDRSVNHDKQWQKPSRQGKPLFRWGGQNRF